MFCNKCGATNSEESNFCSKCGSKLINDKKESSLLHNSGNVISKNDYEAAIKEESDFYLYYFNRFDSQGISISWNWAAFFGSIYWLIYRKMWTWAILYFLLSIALIYFTNQYIFVFHLVAVFILFPMYANRLYYAHVNKNILNIKSLYYDNNKRLSAITTKGGTARGLLITMLIITLISPFAAAEYRDYLQKIEAARIIEDARIAEEARVAEAARIAEAARMAEAARIADIAAQNAKIAYDECKNNETACLAQCEAAPKEDGGFFSSSSYSKCKSRCRDINC